MPTQWVATDVDVCACMLRRCVVSAFSPLHDRGIDAVGGTSCSALRRDPKVSWASELCRRCRLYPSQSHLQLERGQVREKETTTEEERKRDKAIGTERGGQGVYLHLGDGFTVE